MLTLYRTFLREKSVLLLNISWLRGGEKINKHSKVLRLKNLLKNTFTFCLFRTMRKLKKIWTDAWNYDESLIPNKHFILVYYSLDKYIIYFLFSTFCIVNLIKVKIFFEVLITCDFFPSRQNLPFFFLFLSTAMFQCLQGFQLNTKDCKDFPFSTLSYAQIPHVRKLSAVIRRKN